MSYWLISYSPLLRHNVIMRSGYDRLFINLLYAILLLLMGWDNGLLFLNTWNKSVMRTK